MKKYLSQFFDELEIWEDENNNQNYKSKIYADLNNFLDDPTYENACEVYSSFFEAYWLGPTDKNPFLELLKEMEKFEKYAGKLLESHRDHFNHSIWVFILGISVYISNSKFKKHLIKKIVDSHYKDFYYTKHEEFFYRWGLASLFHDIAYPLEIIVKQSSSYIEFISTYTHLHENVVKLFFNFPNDNCMTILPSPEKIKEFNEKYSKGNIMEKEDPISLISCRLSQNFKEYSYEDFKYKLNRSFKKMEDDCRVDHGILGSILMIYWHYNLIKTEEWNPAYFYFPVLDSSISILLHNFYNYELSKNFGAMSVDKDPISYLLILCDILQEWSRKEHSNSEDGNIKNVNIQLTDEEIDIRYMCLDKEKCIMKKKGSN